MGKNYRTTSDEKICRGVSKVSDGRKKPYKVLLRNKKLQFFKTVEEALNFRAANDVIGDLVKLVEQKATNNELQRQMNVNLFGQNCHKERNFSEQVVATWKAVFPLRKAFVLNDSVRGDVILGVSAGDFVQLQIKTASKSNNGNHWTFRNVDGYPDMPLICWRLDCLDGWLYNHKSLCNRRSMNITPGHGVARDAISSEFPVGVDVLIRCIDANLCEWKICTETYARWNFSDTARNQFVEMVTFHAYESVFGRCTFPSEQSGRFDLYGANKEKLQFKHVQKRVGNSHGFKVHLNVSGGIQNIDGKSKSIRVPYSIGDFDTLVLIAIDWHKKQFLLWLIPENVLNNNGLLKNCDSNGKTTFYVHESLCNKKKSMYDWTYAHFKGKYALEGIPVDLPQDCNNHFAKLGFTM